MDCSKLFYLLLSLSCLTHAGLKELKTKQSYDYIRYLSSDGKTSYYQNKKGELIYSSFYKTKVIMESEPLSNYQLQVDGQYALIDLNTNYFQTRQSDQNHKIYIGKLGKEATFYGNGAFPKLHAKWKRLTYIDLLKNQIIIQDLKSKKILNRLEIKSSKEYFNSINIIFITKNDIIYSSVGPDNASAYFYTSFVDNIVKLMFKTSSVQYKLEACLINKKLVIGQFPITNLNLATEIITIDLYNNKNFTSYKQIYSSSLPDQGNMICQNDGFHFIKVFKKNMTLRTTESDLVKFEMKTKTIKRLSEIKSLNNAFKMDKLILTLIKGKYYILDGSQILDDQIEKVKK